MKNWKDKVLGIFAGIGIMSLLMGSYSSQPQQYGTPESHVWDMLSNKETVVWVLNKKTGEMRKLSASFKGYKVQSENGK